MICIMAVDTIRQDLLTLNPPRKLDPPIPKPSDIFGTFHGFVLPRDGLTLSTDALDNDSGQPNRNVPEAQQVPLNCAGMNAAFWGKPKRNRCLSNTLATVGATFSSSWGRSQAICDCHGHLAWYETANSMKTAWQATEAPVLRDLAHLACHLCDRTFRRAIGHRGSLGISQSRRARHGLSAC